MDDYSRKSNSYRKNYMKALSGLYGKETDIDFKAPKTRKAQCKKRDRPEQRLQIKIVQWLKNQGYLVFSIPNHGRRSWCSGHEEVQAGLTAGASDLFLSEPNKKYHGFYIELKAPDKKPTELQFQFGVEAKCRGYYWAWYDNFEIAEREIIAYLNDK